MSWNTLDRLDQITELKLLSQEKPVLIFKHSTRCSISSMAWNRLKRNWKDDDAHKIQPFFLDLIRFREISDQVAQEFQVFHESPQVILIKGGKAVYNTSHLGIQYQEIMDKI
ncbi:bacillithiol system redox-active protein YtxJ [Pararhodonellum marinum]|uniref:bacillithiol system redox-active protein YtxJ n=1 Tax=Pararhodonellum marinum TaxID=2755358 RepID=UPI00188F3EE1|nr:bacillithiol system redox-active protein YtxJ [Pararhodonellum marinum]